MCHDDDSRAPAPPERGPVAAQGPLELTAADGTRLLAHEAVPERFRPGRPGVVLLPDVRGLHPYYRDLAVRFAEAGVPAVAVDWFGRTAGTGERGDDFAYRPHVDQVDPANVALDVAAAVDRLRVVAGAGPVVTVGFCFGGSQSWRLAAGPVELAGVVGFYGKPALVRDVVADMRRPLLLLVAGADAATPPEEFAELDAQLTSAGVEHTTTVYEGAPHSFFDRAYAEWQDAATDAWHRVLAFLDTRPAVTPSGNIDKE
jgi:carboxymethylenebutenolidase